MDYLNLADLSSYLATITAHKLSMLRQKTQIIRLESAAMRLITSVVVCFVDLFYANVPRF